MPTPADAGPNAALASAAAIVALAVGTKSLLALAIREDSVTISPRICL